MVTIKESIPSKSDAFLKGIDIFYSQFNDVNFYIEDEDQENFYFEIFRKMFPKIRLSKIFPLRGKDNVLSKAKENVNNKSTIFLVDKDFDDLLDKIQSQGNLFYLERYSIENYLLNEHSFKEYIIEERPKIKSKTVENLLLFNEWVASATCLFYEITLLHLLVQLKSLGLPNAATPPEKYFEFLPISAPKEPEITSYKVDIQNKLTSVDKRLKIASQIIKIKKRYSFEQPLDIFSHIPGKYLLKYFKCKIEYLFKLPNRNFESFAFRLAKNNNFSSLQFFKEGVLDFLKN